MIFLEKNKNKKECRKGKRQQTSDEATDGCRFLTKTPDYPTSSTELILAGEYDGESMKQTEHNIERALEKSQQLLTAAESGEWDKLEELIKQRDQCAESAFTDSLEESLYPRAQEVWEKIREHNETIERLANASKDNQKLEILALNKNQKNLNTYKQNQ